MEKLDQILTDIAHKHLDIATLETRNSDSLDFHEVSVWSVKDALSAAYQAGTEHRAAKPASPPEQVAGGMSTVTFPQHSPAPWGYGYSPYTVRSEDSPLGVGAEIPAYEIFDANGDKVFDTNEDSPGDLQEANARFAAGAPRLLASLVTCANLLADYDESDGPEGEAFREALDAVEDASHSPRRPL